MTGFAAAAIPDADAEQHRELLAHALIVTAPGTAILDIMNAPGIAALEIIDVLGDCYFGDCKCVGGLPFRRL
jgi:hypothetical protein